MEICLENLQLLEVIGEGAFGKVHKGEYRQDNGKLSIVAVKMLKGKWHQILVFVNVIAKKLNHILTYKKHMKLNNNFFQNSCFQIMIMAKY